MFPRAASNEVHEKLTGKEAKAHWKATNIVDKASFLKAYCAGNESMKSVVKRVDAAFGQRTPTQGE